MGREGLLVGLLKECVGVFFPDNEERSDFPELSNHMDHSWLLASGVRYIQCGYDSLLDFGAIQTTGELDHCW